MYHISQDGKARKCHAASPAACTASGGSGEHFSNMEQASAAAERQASQKFDVFSSRRRSGSFGTAPVPAPGSFGAVAQDTVSTFGVSPGFGNVDNVADLTARAGGFGASAHNFDNSSAHQGWTPPSANTFAGSAPGVHANGFHAGNFRQVSLVEGAMTPEQHAKGFGGAKMGFENPGSSISGLGEQRTATFSERVRDYSERLGFRTFRKGYGEVKSHFEQEIARNQKELAEDVYVSRFGRRDFDSKNFARLPQSEQERVVDQELSLISVNRNYSQSAAGAHHMNTMMREVEAVAGLPKGNNLDFKNQVGSRIDGLPRDYTPSVSAPGGQGFYSGNLYAGDETKINRLDREAVRNKIISEINDDARPFVKGRKQALRAARRLFGRRRPSHLQTL